MDNHALGFAPEALWITLGTLAAIAALALLILQLIRHVRELREPSINDARGLQERLRADQDRKSVV